MKIKNTLIVLFLLLSSGLSKADTGLIKTFVSGSYQQILSANTGNGFMLVFWSIDCTTCIKDLEILSNIHKNRPDLKIVMISVDEYSLNEEIKTELENYRLADVDNWLLAEDNDRKLLYEIDPVWLNELPRTYFFSATHQRDGVSGELKQEDYKARFCKMKI